MKTLVLFAHPTLQHSQTNRAMLEIARGVDAITLVDLYAKYPRFDIDVEEEQEQLLEHDAIVFQFPLYWYSTPSILKEWQDLVLQHGFAYGETGVALKNKLWLCAVTAGAAESAYASDGRQGRPLRHLLAPLEATANLCQMQFLAPYTMFGALDADGVAREKHAFGYARLLEALRDDRLDVDTARRADLLTAHHLDQFIVG